MLHGQFAVICYKWMQYSDKNTIYIQNDEKSENHEFSQILKTHFWNSWFSKFANIRILHL